MAQDWHSLVTGILAEFSSDREEQALLRAKLKQSSTTYQLAFGCLMTDMSTAKVKEILRRALRDMTEEQ